MTDKIQNSCSTLKTVACLIPVTNLLDYCRHLMHGTSPLRSVQRLEWTCEKSLTAGGMQDSRQLLRMGQESLEQDDSLMMYLPLFQSLYDFLLHWCLR